MSDEQQKQTALSFGGQNSSFWTALVSLLKWGVTVSLNSWQQILVHVKWAIEPFQMPKKRVETDAKNIFMEGPGI